MAALTEIVRYVYLVEKFVRVRLVERVLGDLEQGRFYGTIMWRLKAILIIQLSSRSDPSRFTRVEIRTVYGNKFLKLAGLREVLAARFLSSRTRMPKIRRLT